MTVSNPASLSSARAEFSAPANMSSLNRGGSYVPSNASTSISTTAAGLALSQFNGVSKPNATPTVSVPGSSSSGASGANTIKTMVSGSITANPGGGNGSYSYSWKIVSYTNCSSPVINNATSQSCTVTATVTTAATDGTASNTGTIVIQCTVTSGGLSASSNNCSVNLTNYNTAVSCVAVASFLAAGLIAGKMMPGQMTRITDPYSEALSNTCDGEILKSEAHLVPCVRIVLAGGGWLECSTTAPIPTRKQKYIQAQYLQGHDVAATDVRCLSEDSIAFEWEEVAEIQPIGFQWVQLLYVADRCFWASGDGKRFVLHHNMKQIQPP